MLDQWEEKQPLSSDEVIEELKVIAFSKITDYITLGAIPRLRNDIPPHKLAAVKEISHNNGRLVVKLHDSVAALIKLGDYLGMWNDFNLALATLKKYGLEIYRSGEGEWKVHDVSKIQDVQTIITSETH